MSWCLLRERKRALHNPDTCKAFQTENILGPFDPEQLEVVELANKIRTAPVSAAAKILPANAKGEYPEEFENVICGSLSRSLGGASLVRYAIRIVPYALL